MSLRNRTALQLPLFAPEFDATLRRRLPLASPPPESRPRLVPSPAAVQLDYFRHLPHAGADWPPLRYLADIRGASLEVVMTAAWFTDPVLARALIFARAPRKLLIIGDGNDGRRSGPGLALIQVVADPAIEVVRVEAVDALMHCKRTVIDRRIAWYGSANATRGARRNYEELWRQEGGGDLFERYRELDEYLCRIGKRLSTA